MVIANGRYEIESNEKTETVRNMWQVCEQHPCGGGEKHDGALKDEWMSDRDGAARKHCVPHPPIPKSQQWLTK